ncbi:archaellin/type IV pilin N-terminal domain-containing protein [Saccharopolyspora gloriosae]|uniref:Flagellin-like protein n=1 Tax=Saccharopolyspora gloriosae TaxID=455344 RepID=A0A840NS84_9PSEU|nr:archaellin/type IV pilin N-terminal domain-containing protein [Saccharopolyspora gloriosae]MBB5071077.1 flagellin-like protein [Saccharopolyspora gloriosae]
MQISSRTAVSVVGTVMMVLVTVVLAAWSSPQSPVQQPTGAPNGAMVSVLR